MVLLEQQQRLVEAIDAQRTSIQRAEREWRPNTPAGRAMPFEHWTKLGTDLNASFQGLAAGESAASLCDPHTYAFAFFGIVHQPFPRSDGLSRRASQNIDVGADEEFLRRSQRRQWRRDEAEAIRECNQLRVETLRSSIAFRDEATAERREGMAMIYPTLGIKLGQQRGTFELGQRSVRRTRREQQEAASPRWPARPSTAPPAHAPPPQQPPQQQQQRAWNAGPGRSSKQAALRRGLPMRKPTHGRAPPKDAAIWGQDSTGELWAVSGSRAPGLPLPPRQAWA